MPPAPLAPREDGAISSELAVIVLFGLTIAVAVLVYLFALQFV